VYKTVAISTLVVLGALVFGCSDRAAAVSAYHPLVSTDIVLKGKVESIEVQQMDRVEYARFYRDFPGSGAPFFVNIQLGDAHVLRGAVFSDETVSAGLPVSEQLVGEEVMICADWNAGLRRYIAHTERFIFVNNGRQWVSLGGEVVDGVQVDTALQSAELSHLFADAAVVVEGTVTEVLDHQIDVVGMSGPVGLRRFTLHDLKVHKGGELGSTVSFETLAQSNFFKLDNYGRIPENLERDQRLLVFLSRDAENDFLYPIAGVNGLYRVIGNDLIIGNEARLRTSRSKFEAMVWGWVSSPVK
jgi:hypothetical protein